MNSGNTRPIIKQIDEVERHISDCEQKIDEIQKQTNIPAEWFTENFNVDTHQFNSDAVKNAFQQIKSYQSEINVYLNKIGLTREVLNSISIQVDVGDADVDDVKDRMVEEHLELVESLAKNVWNDTSGIKFSDVIQDGTIGLRKAIDNFDYEHGYQFKTYATWWIRQNVSRAMVN